MNVAGRNTGKFGLPLPVVYIYMPLSIRAASPDDIPAMLEIYGQVVLETVISWEYEVPSLEEFGSRFEKVRELGFPWLVAELDGQIVGYTYASRYRERYGYRFGCESTVYVRKGQRGGGIGRRLYETLFEILRRQSFAVVIAGVAHPNPESQGFHESMGFTMVGIHDRIGYKFGKWESVAFLQRDLVPREAISVEEPHRFDALLQAGKLKDLLGAHD